eukprot:Nitzschia sp. Nitz4//scaffold105_size73764//52135//53170//NITZ4_005680-RA/size73764-snap-gene-0.47-mRNA-1//-1//CDS//3329532459//8636//frame0
MDQRYSATEDVFAFSLCSRQRNESLLRTKTKYHRQANKNMVVQELFADLIPVRPGRNLFCCHWRLGNELSSPSEPTSSTTTVNLVCIHGTAANHKTMLSSLRELATELSSSDLTVDCWLFDSVGCGQSPPLSDSSAYSNQEIVKDIQALLKNQVGHLDRPTFFLAHSYGPQLVFQTLLDPETPTLQLGGLILVSIPMMTKMFLQIGFAKETHERFPDMIAKSKIENNANDMAVVCQYYRHHAWMENVTEELRSLCPHPLLLHGTDDKMVPIECGQKLANEWRVQLVAVPKASHMVLMEQPQEIARHVNAYLNEDPMMRTIAP